MSLKMTQNSLIWKLILAFMLVAIVTAALVALFVRVTSVDRLTRLVIDQERNSLQSYLVDYYTAHGSWVTVAADWDQIRAASAVTANTPQPPPPGDRPPGGPDRRKLFGLADAQGIVLVSVDPAYPNGAVVPTSVLQTGTGVLVNGKQVGTILVATFQPRFNPAENLFLQRTNEALFLAMVGAMLVALMIGVLLAMNLIRPLRALTQAAHNITRGQLEQQVKVTSKDEIGELAQAFNTMSQEVARVNLSRREMTANIAHDLRTPLTVIAGYVESMRDGDLEPTTERLSVIYSEIEQLQNLVGDLRMLSQADAGELSLIPQALNPKYLLERAAAPFQHRAEMQGVTLVVEAEDSLPAILVDEARMMQVFGNLISNALRFTPDGGKITLSAYASDDRVELTIKDNGAGIPAEDLPYIFERFQRVDKSRHSEDGESGLGLAIVKSLVEAHGGSVRAESQPDVGTTIFIALPA
jgi:two-component system, OmpR family, sensor histidine kinase BaeS